MIRVSKKRDGGSWGRVCAAFALSVIASVSAAGAEEGRASREAETVESDAKRIGASVTPGARAEAARRAAGFAGAMVYRTLVEKEAGRAGLPSEIADAVMEVESGYDPASVGSSGEIGLMQMLPSTARILGFTGSVSDLAKPENNIHYGVIYLAQAWRLARGDLCTAVMKYRAGHGETRFSHRSVNYCLAVRSKLAARGYRVTGTVPVATFGGARQPEFASPISGSFSSRCRPRCLGVSLWAPVDLEAINNDLGHLVMRASAHSLRLR
jgi:soluble lytic murein transglycosylase-like protein